MAKKALKAVPKKTPARLPVGREKIREMVLGKDPTADYRPQRTAFFGELFVQELPLWKLWTGRMMLASDPIVSFAMDIRDAVLMPADVDIKCDDERVYNWLRDQWETLWNGHRSKLVAAKKFGFQPLQLKLKEKEDKLIHITGVKDFAPEDCRAMEQNHSLVGMHVQGANVWLPQMLWMTYKAEYSLAYGTGCLRTMYPAWYEKWMDHGAKKLLQLRMIKDAYIGDIFWYPMNLALKLPNGQQVSWKDMLREVGEHRLSGAPITLPRVYDSNGKELTGYEPPQDISGASHIFEWNELCDEKMLQGASVPKEIIQAESTGSGYSGRSIPFLVLLSIATTEMTEIVACIDRPLRALAWLNFGKDVDYQISPRSLIDSFTDDTADTPMGGAALGGTASQVPMQVIPQQQGQGGQAVQFGEEHWTENHPHHRVAVRTGDYVKFSLPIFTGGRFFRGRYQGGSQYAGQEEHEGIIHKHSYGGSNGQHTFTILKKDGSKKLVTGRNLYPNLITHKVDPQSKDREGLTDEELRKKPDYGSQYTEPQNGGGQVVQFGESEDSEYWNPDDFISEYPDDDYPPQFSEHEETYRPEGIHSWLDSSGKFHKLGAGETHAEYARKNKTTINELFSKGHARVFKVGRELYAHLEGRALSERQKKALTDKAIEHGLSHVKHDYGDDERTVWSEHDQFDESGRKSTYNRLVREQAKYWGMSPQAYHEHAEAIWRPKRELHEVRESAKAHARKWLRTNARGIRGHENRGGDSDNFRRKAGMDVLGVELASQYGHGLGWKHDDHDLEEKTFNLVREGKQTLPSRTSDEYHAEVGKHLHALHGGYPDAKPKRKPKRSVEEMTSFNPRELEKDDQFAEEVFRHTSPVHTTPVGDQIRRRINTLADTKRLANSHLEHPQTGLGLIQADPGYAFDFATHQATHGPEEDSERYGKIARHIAEKYPHAAQFAETDPPLQAPKTGVTIHGVRFKPGQAIHPSIVKSLKPNDRTKLLAGIYSQESSHGSQKQSRTGNSPTGTATAGAVPGPGKLRTRPGIVEPSGTPSVVHQPLQGLPVRVKIPGHGEITAKPHPQARKAAEEYMKQAGLVYSPPKVYAKVDPEQATKIATAYHAMEHNPSHPETKAAYDAMIRETMGQWQAIKQHHPELKVEFIQPGQADPYAVSPRLATEDVHQNNHLWVFPTSSGFGGNQEFDASHNPLLAESGEQISGQPAKVNDIFRVVHDYFGHIKEGNGFRADGEENAWRSHSAMYTPLARKAMTSETRGQNSWVNYGPHAKINRKADAAQTVYADQKTGLLPDWAVTEGHHDHDIQQFDEQFEEGHKFSSTQFNLPPELCSSIRQLQEQIDRHDLQPTDYGDESDTGLEMNSHVTVLYGLHTGDGEELRALVSVLGPIAIQLGECSVFHADMSKPPDPDKPKYDVLKIEVISKGLHKLHESLKENFEYTSTFPDYKPHITIAYVKPGMGSYYADRFNALKGKTATFDRLIFSDKLRNHLSLPLCGQAQFSEDDHGYESYRPILKNPSLEDANKLLRKSSYKAIRGFHTKSGDRYIWDADHYLHTAAARKLGLSFNPTEAEGKVVWRSFHIEHEIKPEHHYQILGDSQHTEGGTPLSDVTFQFEEETEAEKRINDLAKSGVGSTLKEFVEKLKGIQAKSIASQLPVNAAAGLIDTEIATLGTLLGEILAVNNFTAYLEGIAHIISLLPETAGVTPNMPPPELPPFDAVLFPEGIPPHVVFPRLEEALQVLSNSPVAAGINYKETAEFVRKGAFAVTKDLSDKALVELRDTLADAIHHGKTIPEFFEDVAANVEESGIISQPHLENIYRTNTMSYLSNGMVAAIKEPIISSHFPYARYAATRDARVRPEHKELEELGLQKSPIYRFDDPTFQKFLPPWSYNCRCRWYPVTVEDAAEAGVSEAVEWWKKAKLLAEERGGVPSQYLAEVAPATPSYVTPPPFEPSPEFKRDYRGPSQN